MADSWEEDDSWEKPDFQPVLPGAAGAGPSSSLAAGIDMAKFAAEEEMLKAKLKEQEAKRDAVPESQPKKKEEKKYLREVGTIDKPLDDPIEEKLRQQRLVEQADYVAAKELFGGAGNELDLETFLPRTLKDFEQFANGIVSKYVTVHKDSKSYKGFLKALLKGACASLASSDVKDIETSLAGLRTEKFKAEQAELAASKKTKKHVNVGKAGTLAGGLDDYIYADAGDADDDFM